MTITKAGILALLVCSLPHAVSAQTMQWTDKGYVSVNVGVQVGSRDLSTDQTFPLYEETASVSSTQEVKGGGFFDVGGAYRVYGNNLLAGAAFSRTSSDSNASITASVPDPVFFDRPRNVTSTHSGLKHSENALHLSAIWMMPVANKLDVAVFGGPTIFWVAQDIISSLSAQEPGPVVTAQTAEVKKTTGGIHFGVDVQYVVARKWAVGGLARYSWGSASIEGANEDLTVGGFQLGIGARLRF